MRVPQRASARQHKKILVGGTMGISRLCSDEPPNQSRTYRAHSVKLTPCLFLRGIGTAGTTTKIPHPPPPSPSALHPGLVAGPTHVPGVWRGGRQ